MFFFLCAILVRGLTVCKNDQMYEILGRSLIDPIAYEMHGVSQESRLAEQSVLAFIFTSKDCAKCVCV